MIDQFIAMTRKIIASEGFEDYLPTLFLPTRKEVKVLEDVPEGENVDAVVASWVNRTAKPDEDFIAAYKIDDGHFKVISRIEGQTQEKVCAIVGLN